MPTSSSLVRPNGGRNCVNRMLPSPKPAAAASGGGGIRAKAGDGARGYAAVAAVRRSLEQQRSAEKMYPRPGRLWLSNGKGNPNNSRPSSQPSIPVARQQSIQTARMYAAAVPRPNTAREKLHPSVSGTSPAIESDGGAGEIVKDPPPRPPSLLVFSGGTAFNGVIEELKKLTTNVAHVLPVSDDGGSTSEILRVLGGPALGDIRSRCLRLSDESTNEALVVKRLLGYRLPLNEAEAKHEWYEIVEGEHGLWDDVSGPYRETIRAFLVFFQSQIFVHSKEKFRFANGSIGNFFFAGARIFFQSLEAAIFLYSRVSRISADSLVLPVICTNDRLKLGCELYDGTLVKGQNEISHPVIKDSLSEHAQVVDKNTTPPLPSPIKRIFYMSTDGVNASHEVFPPVNNIVLERIAQVDAVIYGMGSLYTSICPLLVLRGVGEAIAKQTCPKLLLLNGSHDRETAGMSSSDFIISICDALNRKYGDPTKALDNPPTAYVNTLLVPVNGGIAVDTQQLAALGITQLVEVESIQDERAGIAFDPKSLIRCIESTISGQLKNSSAVTAAAQQSTKSVAAASDPKDDFDKRKKSPIKGFPR